MFSTDESIWEIKKILKPFYSKQGTIFCVAVGADVVFNSQGWTHLSFHSNGVRRDDQDLRMRLAMFRHAPNIVKKCRSTQKTTTETIVVKGKQKEAMFFELHYSYSRGMYCTVVVLRKIGDGQIHYWSVRPCNKHKNSR